MVESEFFKKLLKEEQQALSSFLTIAKLSDWEISLNSYGYLISKGVYRIVVKLDIYGRVHRKVRNVIRFEHSDVLTMKKKKINFMGDLSNEDAIKKAARWL